MAGMARHISVQNAAMTSFFRPVFFTARLRGLRERCDVVDDDCGIVTVYVCQLERLVVDQEKDAVLRCQKSVQADLGERWHHVILSFPQSTHLSEAFAQLGHEPATAAARVKSQRDVSGTDLPVLFSKSFLTSCST